MRKYETNLVALYAKAMIAIVNTEIPYRSAKGGKKVKSTPIVEVQSAAVLDIEKSFAPSTNALRWRNRILQSLIVFPLDSRISPTRDP